MNTSKHLIVVRDEEGRSLICKLEHECNDSICRLDNFSENKKNFKDLSERERSSCKVLVGNIW